MCAHCTPLLRRVSATGIWSPPSGASCQANVHFDIHPSVLLSSLTPGKMPFSCILTPASIPPQCLSSPSPHPLLTLYLNYLLAVKFSTRSCISPFLWFSPSCPICASPAHPVSRERALPISSRLRRLPALDARLPRKMTQQHLAKIKSLFPGYSLIVAVGAESVLTT